MIKGAVFDIDGTLIDSMKIWDQLGARYLRQKGIEPEEKLAEILFPMTIAQGVHYLKTRYKLTESEEEIRQGLTDITDAFYRYEVELKPGVKEALSMMKDRGIPMLLATIGDPDLEQAALSRLGIWDYFQDMLVCEEYHTTKKEAKIYQIAAEKMGIEPQETVVFEDIYQAVHTAREAGFVVCGLADEASRSQEDQIREEANLFLDEFTQLDMLKNLLGADL